jgi:iron complex outermembrane receptor protein
MERRSGTGRNVGKIFVLAFFALSLVTSPTWAQSGTVSGTVVDTAGRPILGVQVSLLNEDGSGTGMVATSDENGEYSITGVAAGTYRAAATMDGFQRASRPVEIAAGAQVTVAFELNALFHKELIVSAQKVEEDILDVPMTITAFDTEMMEKLQIQSSVDLQELTPGLQFGDETQQGGHNTVIRGIGSKDQIIHQDRAVATYVDGAYTLGTYGIAPGGGFDMERVEVARGPQGTLHGRNSIAGSINLVNTKPTERWDTTLMGEVTDVSRQRFNVAVGGPLGGAFSFRLTGGIYTGDGIQENIGFGGDHDAPDQNFWAPQLRVRTARFDMNMRWSHVEDTGTTRSLVQLANFNTTDPYNFDPITGEPIPWEPNPFYLYATPNPAVDPGCPPGVPGWQCGDLKNKIASNFPSESSSESDLGTLYAQYQISDGLSLRYNFSYSDVAMSSTKDTDYTNRVSIPEDHTIASDGLLEGGNETWLNAAYELPFTYDEISHELLFTSSYPGKFNFIGGLFYYDMEDLWYITRYDFNTPWRFVDADEHARANSPLYGFWPAESCQDTLAMIETLGWGTTDPDRADEFEGLVYYCPEGSDHSAGLAWFTGSTMETKAAFLSGNYQFNENWTLSGGIRYTEDTKEQAVEDSGGYALFSFGSLVGVTFALGEGAGRPVTWSRPIGHLALEHRTKNGSLIYGRVSTGYRAGGFNITEVPGQVPPFIEEETLVNYEIGGKGLFFNSRLQITTAAWYYDFDNYQFTATQAPPPGVELPPSIWSTTPLVEFTTNIDDTKVWGLDFEFSWWITNQFSLMGYYAFQDSEIGPHESVLFGDPDAEYGEWEHIDFETGEWVTSLYELPTDQTGNNLPMQPEHKVALTAGYNIPLGSSDSDIQLLATYSYTGEMWADIGNIPIYEIPSHYRWDLSATWTAPGGKWALTLFGKNLTDEIGVVEFQPVSGLGHAPPLGYLTNPREVGLQVYWRPFR